MGITGNISRFWDFWMDLSACLLARNPRAAVFLVESLETILAVSKAVISILLFFFTP